MKIIFRRFKCVFYLIFLFLISNLILLQNFNAASLISLDGIDQSLSSLVLFPLFLIALFLLVYGSSKFRLKTPNKIGFLSIVPDRPQKYFVIPRDIINMEPVVKMLCDKKTNVYSNLSKLLITHKSNSILMEDKNFKNSILINRRRNRRCVLYHGDIIDMGELTLMFMNPNQIEKKNFQPPNQKQSNTLIRNQKSTGKLLKNVSSLIPSDTRRKTFYLTKNITFIGRSDTNDLVTKNKTISMKHAKVERIAGRHKLIDLNSINGTFVNGRRVEEKYMKDGDEVTFESIKYLYSESGKSS